MRFFDATRFISILLEPRAGLSGVFFRGVFFLASLEFIVSSDCNSVKYNRFITIALLGKIVERNDIHFLSFFSFLLR